MNQENTRRGKTQKTSTHNCHAERSLLSIPSAFKKQGGDPEQELLRMTPNLITTRVENPRTLRAATSGMTPFDPPSPAPTGHPLPQGAREKRLNSYRFLFSCCRNGKRQFGGVFVQIHLDMAARFRAADQDKLCQWVL